MPCAIGYNLLACKMPTKLLLTSKMLDFNDMENHTFNTSIGIQSKPTGIIEVGTSSEGYIAKLLLFLEEVLPKFGDSNFKILKKYNEDDITTQVVSFLQNQRRRFFDNGVCCFEFCSQEPQKKTRKIDIGTYINIFDNSNELFFCIEAKRLPPPDNKKEREKEYVSGKKGGIARFKTNQHGIMRDSGKLIAHNAMFGYVEKHDFEYWYHQINTWIEDDWGVDEMLQKEYFNAIAKLKSEHARTDTDEKLYLTHFWLPIVFSEK